MKKLICALLAVVLALSTVSAFAANYTDKATVKKVQQALNEAGYDCGTPDGAAGKKTKAAITSYQTDKSLTVTGVIDDELLVALGLAEAKAVEEAPAEAETAEVEEGLPQIDFRGAKLGTSFGEVKDTLEIGHLSDLWYGIVTPDELATEYWNPDYENYILSYFMVGVIDGVEVAGFTPSQARVNFYKSVVNGEASENEDECVFYGAYYRFDEGDLDRIREELKEKLSKLYGEPQKRDISFSLYGFTDNYTVFTWKGQNNVEVTLTEESGRPYVTLAYLWNGAKTIIENILSTPYPEIDTEGNMTGL